MSSGGKGSEESSEMQRSFVDPAQAGFLQQLRTQAQGAAFPASQQAGAFGQQFGGQQGAEVIQGLAQQFGNAVPGLGAAQQALAGFQNQGFQAENPLLGESFVGDQIDQLGGDINRQLQRQIGGAGGLNTQAVLAGNLGGGRNQVQRGIANEGALDAFSRGATQLRAGDLAQRQQLTNQLGLGNLQGALAGQGQQLQALQGAGQLAGAQEQFRQQGLGSQIGAQGDAFNLGLGGINAGLGPLGALAGIIGSPTVLSVGEGRSRADEGFSLGGFGGFLGGGASLLGALG